MIKVAITVAVADAVVVVVVDVVFAIGIACCSIIVLLRVEGKVAFGSFSIVAVLYC